MLHLNIDCKNGLVNGSIGSVTTITSKSITAKFDHISALTVLNDVRNYCSVFMFSLCLLSPLQQLLVLVKQQDVRNNSSLFILSLCLFSPLQQFLVLVEQQDVRNNCSLFIFSLCLFSPLQQLLVLVEQQDVRNDCSLFILSLHLLQSFLPSTRATGCKKSLFSVYIFTLFSPLQYHSNLQSFLLPPSTE